MKPTLVVAIALAFCIYLAPRSEGQERPGTKAKATTAQNQNGSPPSVQIPYQIQNQWVERDAGNSAKESPPWYKYPEWILVIVGIITCGVIGWQSFETRRAASAARDSIGFLERQTRLQESAALQFVSIYPQWEVEVSGMTSPLTGKFPTFHVSFRVRNDGDMPVGIYIELIFGRREFSEVFKFESGFEINIPPKDGRLVCTYLPATEVWKELYAESDGVAIPIEGKIRHSGVLGEAGPTSDFKGLLRCGEKMGTSWFEPETIKMVPVMNWEPKKR